MKKIVFPEIQDERVLSAVLQLATSRVCLPVVLGTEVPDALRQVQNIEVINPEHVALPVAYDGDMQQNHDMIIGATLVATGKVDGIIAGATVTTAEVFRIYKRIIGLAPGVTRAASCFLMKRGEEKYLFADCAININPDADTLAKIAVMTHQFSQKIGMESKVAFLSFATGESAVDASVEKIREAVELTKKLLPDIVCDGPLQVDSAIIPEIAQKKSPDSILMGTANILVFPDLNSGNIAYKLVQRLGGFTATGPLLLGFAKPAHDLSRGCSVADIVALTKVVANQC